MKKIIVLFAVVMGLSALFVANAQLKAPTLPPKMTPPIPKIDKTITKIPGMDKHIIMAPGDLQWADAPPSLPPGAKIAVLDGDPKMPGSFTIRLKTPAGYKIAPHTHPTAERVTGISGRAKLGMGPTFDEAAASDVLPGSFGVMPAGMAHFAYTPEEAIVQIQSEGPFEVKYVNPADDPRNKISKP